MNGWKPVKPFSMVNWCGHGIEYQPVAPAGWVVAVGASVGAKPVNVSLRRSRAVDKGKGE